MRYLMLLLLLACGMQARGQTRTYINPCNGYTVTLPANSGCVYYIEKTLREWRDNGTWNRGVILTDALARQLPAGDYYITETEKAYFEPELLRGAGPCGAWEFKTGTRTSFSEFCDMPALPLIQDQVLQIQRSLNCLDMPPIWTIDGDHIVVRICDREYRYKKNSCPCRTWEPVRNMTICAGEYADWRQFLLNEPGTYQDSIVTDSCTTVFTLNLDVLPPITSITDTSIMAGDSLLWGWEWRRQGQYTDTLTADNGCDSIATLIVRELPKPCDPCLDAWTAWYRLRYISAQAFAQYELMPFGWEQRFPLYGGSIYGEYKFKHGLLFRNNRCWGESVRLGFTIRTANRPLITGDGCVNCNNYSPTDKFLWTIGLDYGIHYLRGWPYWLSWYMGPRLRHQGTERTDMRPTNIGIASSIEGAVMITDRISLFSTIGAEAYRLFEKLHVLSYVAIGARYTTTVRGPASD